MKIRVINILTLGELIEQNQDGLEYSSEEENEDIKDTAANLASKQRKELAKVDHSSLEYMPFRKAFYTEVIYRILFSLYKKLHTWVSYSDIKSNNLDLESSLATNFGSIPSPSPKVN